MKRVYNRSDYFGVRGDSVFVLVRLGGWVGRGGSVVFVSSQAAVINSC